MAITKRTATVAESASVTSLTGTIPTNTAAGDFMLAAFVASSTLATFTPPSGWTALITINEYVAGQVLAPYYKIAAGGDTAPSASTSGAAGRWTCIMQSFIGVDNGTPIDVAAVVTTVTATSIVCTGVTTATDEAMVISGVGGNFSTGVWTQPAALTLEAQHTSGTGRSDALADAIQASAGPTGTQTWTHTAASLALGGFVGALRPDAGGPPPPPAPIRIVTGGRWVR